MGTIGNWWLLAAESSGFGLNFDILDTNLINLAILIGILVFYGRKLLGKILADRQARIAEEIAQAEVSLNKAEAELAEAKKNLAEAEETAKKIIAEAAEKAEATKAAIAAKAEADIERLKESAQKDLDTERDRAIAALKRRIATLAVERSESQMKNTLDGSAQNQLIDRSIAQIGGGS
ncbi:MAG: F0F1 ATP synthase subunit B [Prochloraceae cyanobacterium]|nr:F0F1 ATP synthase subunit B [Prochloraceae cyanobacterium]